MRHSHTNTCSPPLKEKQNANSQRFPFFSWLSEGVWEVLTSTEANTTAPRWGFLLVVCVTVWCERTCTAAEQETDGRGAPVLQLMPCQRKKNQNKQKSAIVKQELCKSFLQLRCPLGIWGSWMESRVAATSISKSSRPLIKDGLSVPSALDTKLTSNEARVGACGITWRRSRPLFFTTAWWNAAEHVLRPKLSRSAQEKSRKNKTKQKTKLSVRWAAPASESTLTKYTRKFLTLFWCSKWKDSVSFTYFSWFRPVLF